MPATYSNRPPLYLQASGGYNVRNIDLPNGQAFDVLSGSGGPTTVGDVLTYPAFSLYPLTASGSGPTYNITFTYPNATSGNTGCDKIKINDKFLIVNSGNIYRYEFIMVPTGGVSPDGSVATGVFTVKYIKDQNNQGYISPTGVIAGYTGAYGQFKAYVCSVSRELNHQFLFDSI